MPQPERATEHQELAITVITMVAILTFTVGAGLFIGSLWASIGVLVAAVMWLVWDRKPMHEWIDKALDDSDRAVGLSLDARGVGDWRPAVKALWQALGAISDQLEKQPVVKDSATGPIYLDRPTPVQQEAPTRPDFAKMVPVPNVESYGRHAR